MKAYKVFNNDWTCKGFKYEVGKKYELKGKPELCKYGFHACRKAIDCFSYYLFDPKTKVAEVELAGDIVGIDGDKQVSNKIIIVREIKWDELLDIVNIGNRNSGYRNSGDYNSGDYNSGDYNSGDYNSGDYNSGDCNSGDYNSGNRNSGDRNSGDYNSGYYNSGNRNSGYRNSGDYNSGDCNSGYRNSGYCNSGYRNSGDRNSGDGNSGDYNSGDCNSGCFNTKIPDKIMCFNKMIKWNEYKNIEKSEGYAIVNKFRLYKYRVRTSTGKYGDYKYCSYKQSWKIFWNNLIAEEKLKIIKIPYFDKDVFYEITGVKINI